MSDKKIKKIKTYIDKFIQKGSNNNLEYERWIDDLINRGDYSLYQDCIEKYYHLSTNDKSVDWVKRETWKLIREKSITSYSSKLNKMLSINGVYMIANNVYENILSYTMSSTLSVTFSTTGLTSSILIENDIIDILNNNVYKIDLYKCDWELDTPSNLEYINTINVGTQSSYKTDISLEYNSVYDVRVYERSDFLVTNYRYEIIKDNLLGSINEIEVINSNKYYILNKEYGKLRNLIKTNLEVSAVGLTTSVINTNDANLTEEQNLLNRYKEAILLLKNYE